jgi:methyl-accepting chemotaxis protein
MNHTYTLSEIEKRNFANDEYRAAIRQKATADATTDDTVSIVDEEGNLFDSLTGSKEPVGLAVVVDPDEQKRVNTANEQLAKYAQIRGEIATEFHAKIREHRIHTADMRDALSLHIANLKSTHADVEKALETVQAAHDTVNHAIEECDKLHTQMVEMDAKAAELEAEAKEIPPPADDSAPDTKRPAGLETTSTETSGSQSASDTVR